MNKGVISMFDKLRLDNWYTIFVLTGEEDKVKQRLRYRFGDEIRFIVPKRKLLERKEGKVHEVTRVLFPGYILVQGDISRDIYPVLKNIPGLIRMLGDDSLPYIVEPNEMKIISKLIAEDEIIGYTKLLEENGRVKVIDGPLVNLEGNIINIDKRKCRAKICMSLCGSEHTVDLGIELIKPISTNL